MPDYQKSKIYALKSHQTPHIYIGSTTKLLSNRLAGHKYDFKNKNSYISSKEILKYDDCYIELIEEYPCNNKMELNRREGEYIRKMDCVNKVVAGRTDKEWRNDNADIISIKKKIYRDENRDRIKERQREYRNNNKELIREKKRLYREKNKDKISEKKRREYLENREHIRARCKLNYEKNREKIALRSKERVVCDMCNLEICRGSLKRHKTKYCKLS
jgi:hypothetical protein